MSFAFLALDRVADRNNLKEEGLILDDSLGNTVHHAWKGMAV